MIASVPFEAPHFLGLLRIGPLRQPRFHIFHNSANSSVLQKTDNNNIIAQVRHWCTIMSHEKLLTIFFFYIYGLANGFIVVIDDHSIPTEVCST